MFRVKMIIKKISWLCLLCISSASFATERDPSWLADYMAMRQLIELGDSAAQAEDWNAAASYYAKATSSSQAVPSKIGLWFAADAMRAYAKVGNAEALESIIKHSVGKGYGLSGFLENSSEFDEFRDGRDFEDSLKLIKRFDEQYEKDHSSPESAKLAFDDVPRFWRAYDLAKQEKSKSAKAAIFRKHYLANGTAGAIEYHWIKTGSMERLVERIEKSPEFYDGIRAQTLKAASYEPKIREGFIALEKLYPDTYFPEVSFVIGRLNSGGTAGPSGMLIGLDVWSWTEGVSLDGVSPGFQTLLKENSLEKLPLVVIHEHIHAMQLYTESSYTVLRAALQEGTADFLAMMALPEAKAPNYFSWGYKNEERIWSRFKKEMNGTNTGDWVGNNGEDYGDDWHADLGYFVGAQIAKAYFEQAEDKQQAIKDLLNVSDSNSILVKSGYADRFNVVNTP